MQLTLQYAKFLAAAFAYLELEYSIIAMVLKGLTSTLLSSPYLPNISLSSFSFVEYGIFFTNNVVSDRVHWFLGMLSNLSKSIPYSFIHSFVWFIIIASLLARFTAMLDWSLSRRLLFCIPKRFAIEVATVSWFINKQFQFVSSSKFVFRVYSLSFLNSLFYSFGFSPSFSRRASRLASRSSKVVSFLGSAGGFV